jgi:serine/threonine protein kinase
MLNTTSIETLCMGCFAQHGAPVDPCQVCGYPSHVPPAPGDIVSDPPPPHWLRPRTILNGKYLLGRVLGEGGFGITYIGWDLTLDLKVAVKEFYPNGFVTRESTVSTNVQPFTGSQGDFFRTGREKFINEAKTLAKFRNLPGIVAVNEFFQENGTAYIVMEFVEGQTMKEYLAKMGGRLPAGQVFEMMKPVTDSLREVHKSGIIHRDISPDNIMISKEGSMKLLDFGAARDFADSGNKSMSILLKPGYAPEEQYRSRGKQGPWTDIYALCATMYRCMTGVTPTESNERVIGDDLKPPSALGISIDPPRETALMTGMAVFAKDRFLNVDALHKALYEERRASQPDRPPSVERLDTPQPEPVAETVYIPPDIKAAPRLYNKALRTVLLLCGICVFGLAIITVLRPLWDSGRSGTSAPSRIPPVETSSPAPSVILGQKIQFGGYDWLVMDIRDGNALLLSEKVIFDYPDVDEDVFLLSLEEVVKYFGDSGQSANRSEDTWYIDDMYSHARIALNEDGKASPWELRTPDVFVGGNGIIYFSDDGFDLGYFANRFSDGEYDWGFLGIRPAMWVSLES